MQIRDLLPQDRDALIAMMDAFYRSPACDHEVPQAHFLRTFEALMDGTPLARCFMLEADDGQLAGYALLALTWSNEAGGLTVWIDELLVQESLRGQGIGRSLLAFLQVEYPSAARFRLEVTPANTRAAALYAALGYQRLDYDQMILDS